MAEPWFSSTIDGMAPLLSGNPTSTAASLAVTAQRGILAPASVGNGAISPVLPVRTSGNAGAAILLSNAAVSEPNVELLGAGLTNKLRFTKVAPGVNGTVYIFQYWDGSAWVNVGSSFDLGNSSLVTQLRFEWSGYGTSSGAVSIRVFRDAGEALVAARSVTGLNFTSHSGIVQMRVLEARGGQPSNFSTMFVCDADGDSSYVYNNVGNANGADTGGTGTFASINDVGANYDTSFISLPSSGNRRSVKNTADRVYDNRTVRAVAVNVRLRRGATGVTQARVYLTIGGTRYYHPTTLTLTTSFEPYCMVWETDPSTSSAWTLTNAQAASLEWGVEAV